MLKAEIPNTTQKIKQQIKALEHQLSNDTNDKDREIHGKTLELLRKELGKYE